MRTALKTIVAATTAVVVLALMAAFVGFPSFGNPFASKTEVRDHAALLQSLEEIAELRAATGEYQVVIDIEQSTRFVPGFLKGQRTTFLAQGSVDALIDLGELDEDSVIVAEDGSVTVLLPPARLAEPVVDHEASGVLNRNRGVLDRMGGVFSDEPTSDKGLYLEAERRLAEAAAESDLLATGEANAAATVEQLLRDAGIERVRVLFVSPDAVT